jgi:hypothetical protein
MTAMSSTTTVAFSLFPIGIGEDDVGARGEVPVLLTAVADTTPTLPRNSEVAQPASALLKEMLRVQQRARKMQHDTLSTLVIPNTAVEGLQSGSATVSGEVLPLTSSSSAASPTANTTKAATAAGVAPSSPELACRMHYMAASYFSEVQRRAPLARCLPGPASPQRRCLSPASGFAEVVGGIRCYYVCPVEDGRYVAVVCLPRNVWKCLGRGDGTAYAHYILHTTLNSTALPLRSLRQTKPDDAAYSSYTPLQTRLTAAPELLQQCMAARLKTVAHLSKCVAAQPQRYAPRLAALHRLCTEEASPLRTHPRLRQRVDELLQRATSSTSFASLRGVIPAMGLNGAKHRYVVDASALWYRGHPLFTSLTSAEQHQQQSVVASFSSKGARLRSAALSVVLEEMEKLSTREEVDVSFRGADIAPVSVTSQCYCVASLGGPAAQTRAMTSGYISQAAWPSKLSSASTPSSHSPGRLDDATATPSSSSSPPAVSMAFTTSSGWTVALLLQPMRTPYVGAPLSTIFSGLQDLVTDGLENDDFLQLLQDATTSMRGGTWRRPVHLVSPLTAELESAVCRIKVGRRLPGGAASSDRVLYSLDMKAAAAAAALRNLASASAATSPSSRCGVPFGSLCINLDSSKVDKKRKAALIAAYAAAQRRHSLSDADDFIREAADRSFPGGPHCRGDGCLTPAVEAAVQMAMRYAHLTARMQRCSGALRKSVSRCGVVAHTAPPLRLLQRRTQSVFSVVTTDRLLRLVKAVPYRCNSASSTLATSLYVVMYVVVDVETKKEERKLSASAMEELGAFTSWVLSRCL